MPDYSKTIIYKIVCKDVNINYLYVGSTTNLKERIRSHEYACNNETNNDHNQKKYVQMREHGGFKNFDIIELEKYPCNDKNEAHTREEEVRLELKANMNSYRCYLTAEQKKEHYKVHRELNKNYYKEYRENNNDAIKEQNKKNYEINKNKISIQNKEYRELNKVAIRKYKHEYYENNREKFNEKFDCECSGKYTHKHRARHLKSTKHQNYITKL